MRELDVGPPNEAPAPELVESGFALEVADAPLLHHGLNLADMAHVLMLGERGIVPAQVARGLLRELLEVHEQIPAEAFPYHREHGDAYNCRERFFIDRLGNDAGWLHAGRPRREAGRIALRLKLRRLVGELVLGALGFSDAVARRADEHAGTLLPDQTYLQQAQPSTFGHYLLTFAYPALREADRLLAEARWANRSPAGAGCVNGSRLPLDRQRMAELLGFDGVIAHTRDAMWQTDGLIAILAGSAGLVTNLSKLAEDLEIWDSQEFDFVALAAPYTRASVLMPQKRNPYALSIVRGAAGILIGRLSGFLAVVKTPSARTDNLIYAYGEVPRSVELAAKIARLMRGVVSTLEVRPERMRQALLDGFSQATDLAEFVMVTCRVDYRTSYLVVGAAIQAAARRGLRGIDLTGEMLDAIAEEQIGRPLGLSGRDLGPVLDPGAIVMTRTLLGGAAPGPVRQMAEECRREATELRSAAEAAEAGYDAAEANLLTRARELARG